MPCAACGYEAPPDFAFCPKCGQRLADLPATTRTPLRDDDDRRPATVLFADLTGFTALAETLDPEDVRALQTDLFGAMSSAVERYDGFVEKYVGDAVMAVFGAPVAHDDDPERALHAALRMHEAVATLAGRWRARLGGGTLSLHVGIDTGAVVAGRIGSARDAAYAVTGDAVNAASRLQNAAASGQTLVADTTFRLVRHAFDFDPPVSLTLKGKSQPVTAHRLRRALDAPRPARGLHAHGLAAPLIGRERELAALLGDVEAMLAGQTCCVGIVADAGTGKTRLTQALLDAVGTGESGMPLTVRRAACSALGERAFAVPAALLRDAYGIASDDDPATARQKLVQSIGTLTDSDDEARDLSAALGVVLGLDVGAATRSHLDPEQVKRRVFAALQAVAERRVQRGALLLVVEDLHWADAASVELLHDLLDRLSGRRLMLLATYRPMPELDALAAAAQRHRLLRLQPLSPSQAATLVAALFGRSERGLSDELRARIVEPSGGNPLFIEETVRALIADGVLVHEPEGWVVRPGAGKTGPPQTIHGLLLGRIDRLPAPARRAVHEAAVVGPTFAAALLRRVAAEPESLDSALATLVDAGLIVPAGDAVAAAYRFSHGLFQEVAYHNLLARRRTELHSRIGEAIEHQYVGEPARLEDLQALGHHFRLGADQPRAARYLVAAGDWARGLYANADAIRSYELALESLAACGDCEGRTVEIEERLGDVLAPAGRIADALRHLEAARAARSRQRDPIGQARLLRKIAALHWEGGDRAGAGRCLDDALALIADEPPHLEHAKLHQELGQRAFRSGDPGHALRWTQRAIDDLERLSTTGTEPGADQAREHSAAFALALNTQGAALARCGRLTEAVVRLERCVEVARAADLPQVECRALSNLGVLYSSRDPRRAIDACERGLQTAQRIGDVGLQSRLYANLAVAYCTLTNRCDEKGVGAARSAIDIDRRTGQLDHLAVSLVVLAQIEQCHGDPARALAYYREALALAEVSGEAQLLFPCYDGLATLNLDCGDDAEAGRYMQLASATCERAGIDPEALVVLPFLA